MAITQKDIPYLLSEVHRAWDAACLYDQIPPGSSFIILSKENPYSGKYHKAMIKYLKACRAREKRQSSTV